MSNATIVRSAVRSTIESILTTHRLIAVMLALAIGGCASGGGSYQSGYQSGVASPPSSQASAPAAAAAASDSGGGNQPRGGPNDATGLWQGTSRAGCQSLNPMGFNTRCSAINNIQLTLIQEGSKISGFYKCSTGNQDCRNQNDSGTVGSGDMRSNGRVAMRIAMPDGSSCIFNGLMAAANQMKGSYSCYQGGGLAEQGSFQVSRNY